MDNRMTTVLQYIASTTDERIRDLNAKHIKTLINDPSSIGVPTTHSKTTEAAQLEITTPMTMDLLVATVEDNMPRVSVSRHLVFVTIVRSEGISRVYVGRVAHRADLNIIINRDARLHHVGAGTMLGLPMNVHMHLQRPEYRIIYLPTLIAFDSVF